MRLGVCLCIGDLLGQSPEIESDPAFKFNSFNALCNLNFTFLYIFAVGLITRKDRVVGVLYGAGPTVECNRNQIYGYWLQKKLVLPSKPGYTEGNGAEYEAQGALEANRQWFKLPLERPIERTLSIYNENGTTLLGTEPVSLKPGAVYQLHMGTN